MSNYGLYGDLRTPAERQADDKHDAHMDGHPFDPACEWCLRDEEETHNGGDCKGTPECRLCVEPVLKKMVG
jgi:hypothetical protein